MKKILLDTNFLISYLKFRLSFDEMEKLMEDQFVFLTLDSVVKELEKLSKLEGKDSRYAKLALEFIKQKKIEVIRSPVENADKAILKVADKNTIVATNDIRLKKELRVSGIKTIYMRAKKHLAIG